MTGIRRGPARNGHNAACAWRVAGGVLAATSISLIARRARALSRGGAVAAAAAGTLALSGVGFHGGAALVAFFASSTLLGRLPGKTILEQRRGNERDAVQVLANGGVAALLALASAVGPPRARPLFHAGFAGAVAAAAADTWATEIGSRSRRQTRSIVTLQPVPPGVSGGVTWAGIAASAAGATVIAAIASAGTRQERQPLASLIRAVILGGVSGALVDSLLGATVQEVRFCDACNRQTEMRVHSCGQQTRPIRGASWCDNDVVNAIATAVGAGVAMSVVGLAFDHAEFDNA